MWQGGRFFSKDLKAPGNDGSFLGKS